MSLGFSRQTARYPLKLAEDISAKRFRVSLLSRMSDDDARASITSRLEMDNWTADVFLMMGLLRPDVFQIGDLALVKGVQEIDGEVYDDADTLMARAAQ